MAENLSRCIWSGIHTQREALYTADSIGNPFTGGGFNATLRDVARLGQMMLDGGRVGSEQIIPPAAIARIRAGGGKATFAKAGYMLQFLSDGKLAGSTMMACPPAIMMQERKLLNLLPGLTQFKNRRPTCTDLANQHRRQREGAPQVSGAG